MKLRMKNKTPMNQNPSNRVQYKKLNPQMQFDSAENPRSRAKNTNSKNLDDLETLAARFNSRNNLQMQFRTAVNPKSKRGKANGKKKNLK